MNIKKNILRFTVSMDKDLLDELLRITGQKKKSRAVNIGLQGVYKDETERSFTCSKRKIIKLRGIR